MLELAGWGLRPVELADSRIINDHFSCLREPVSDYTFSQLFTWRNSLRIAWRQIAGHLCVFANGSGDLTLLLPPVGEGDPAKALAGAFEIMNDYNSRAGVPDHSRVEYVSEELLSRLGRERFDVQPLGGDYVYDVSRMIDLAGGELASKRQAKNRFLRLYQHRVEMYDSASHLDGCLALLGQWRDRQDAYQSAEASAVAVKRRKESLAAELTLRHAGDLGLRGMVVYVTEAGVESIRGFTFGEALGMNQSSIVIEKTDLSVKGLAQFVFSEFCRRCWSDRPLVNVGDDWGLESLAWTKQSYRPVKMLGKYVLRQTARVAVATRFPELEGSPGAPGEPRLGGSLALQMVRTANPTEEAEVRLATEADVVAVAKLEQSCFKTHRLSQRQLAYLRQRDSAVFLVATDRQRVIGEGIALVRRHRKSKSGRIYSLAVDEASRGRRIGRRLLNRMMTELRTRGVGKVYLEVDAGNTPAIRLYEQNGFRRIGELRDYYGAGLHAAHMVCT